MTLNIAEGPTGLALSATSASEATAVGTVLATLSATSDNPLTYTLTDDADGTVELVTSGGVTRLVLAKALDYEAATSFDITVEVSDGIEESTKTFTFGVLDANEAPTTLTVSTQAVREDADVGDVVATLSSTDPEGDAVTYSLVSNPGDVFRIEGDTLVLNTLIDFADAETRTIELAVTDADGLTKVETFTFDVTDVVNISVGSDGTDVVEGNKGVDRFLGGDGNDRLYGNGGDDRLKGEGGDDQAAGGAGDDSISGNRGSDRLFGGAGGDTIDGGEGDDVLQGGDGDDDLTGNGGDDVLRGNGGDDVLRGRIGADVLNGGTGDDILSGGYGADLLTGGSGADTFAFRAESASPAGEGRFDTILDFNVADGDRIDLTGFDANGNRSGIQPFDFIGTDGFSGKAGELRYGKLDGDTFVRADLDGDSEADFVVKLEGGFDLQSDSFLL
ncbi:hypothetical protein LXM94_02885 [Rhizobium sp. TRM95111]|uniref:hypothetical protein n=1 Tax=Rhizobium alarense TaxID=2846851 RepID=UPI001F3F5ECC|nr:hypothetical protein [Rhizobium alarense]MCF3638914.1 hypothetical protein [Rhizobium alarense]